MTLLRACLDCGAPSPWTRCALHRQSRTRIRNGNRRFAKDVIAAQPWCSICGSTRDLTSDHVQALARGGSNEKPQRTLCRPCNSRLGGRLGGNEGRGPQ